MSTVEAIIITIIIFVGIAVVYDTVRKNRAGANGNNTKTPTANEALPTATGRFKAQQALQQNETEVSLEEPQSAGDQQLKIDEDEPLPDPFDSSKSNSGK